MDTVAQSATMVSAGTAIETGRGMGPHIDATASRAIRWLAASVFIGLACGGAAVLLSIAVDAAFRCSQAHPALVVALPALAVTTSLAYRAGKVPFELVTADVVSCLRGGKPVPAALAPLIAFGTCASTLGGASVGKTGPALQMGAAIGSALSDADESFREDRGLLLAAGVAASFSAVMFAPLAASLFALELMRPTRESLFRWRTLSVPTASAVAYLVSDLFDVARLEGAGKAWPSLPSPLDSSVFVPPDLAAFALGTTAVGALCAFGGMAFCLLLKLSRRASASLVPNPHARMAASGAALACIAGLSLAASGGTFNCVAAYGGTGAAQISAALAGETLPLSASFFKLLVTVVCLGSWMKGGEIMPCLCLGACMGNALAQASGLAVAPLSGVGAFAFFAACTACPASATVLGCEIVGWRFFPWLALACLLASVFSRRFGLYRTEDRKPALRPS